MHVHQIYLYVYTTLFSSVLCGCYVFAETNSTNVTPHIYTSINRDMICVEMPAKCEARSWIKRRRRWRCFNMDSKWKAIGFNHMIPHPVPTYTRTLVCTAGSVVIIASKRWSLYEANLSFNFPKTCSFRAQSSVNICWIFSEVISTPFYCLRIFSKMRISVLVFAFAVGKMTFLPSHLHQWILITILLLSKVSVHPTHLSSCFVQLVYTSLI